jgi:hypothetical protein
MVKGGCSQPFELAPIDGLVQLIRRILDLARPPLKFPVFSEVLRKKGVNLFQD